jgi:membrane-bound serine protease (ClpP class)
MNDPAVTVAALLVAGYLLLAVELFVIPGFGVVGISGILCLLAGCYFAYHFFGGGYGAVAVVLVLSSTTAVLVWIPKTRFGRDVVHSTTLESAHAGATSVGRGQIGIAESNLRPAGIARFGEVRESVVTEGEYIESGAKVVVADVRGSRIVVELAPASASASASASDLIASKPT